jgi:hypothetical protein
VRGDGGGECDALRVAWRLLPPGIFPPYTTVRRWCWLPSVTASLGYKPRKWGVIAHLEIRCIAPAGAPLPISSTGYRSYFHESGTSEAHGGDVVAQVTAWLDEEATKPEWQTHIARTRQGELF